MPSISVFKEESTYVRKAYVKRSWGDSGQETETLNQKANEELNAAINMWPRT